MIRFQALWKTKSSVKVCLKFKLPLWTKGLLIHLSPLWQLPLWHFPRWHNFPVFLTSFIFPLHRVRNQLKAKCHSLDMTDNWLSNYSSQSWNTFCLPTQFPFIFFSHPHLLPSFFNFSHSLLWLGSHFQAICHMIDILTRQLAALLWGPKLKLYCLLTVYLLSPSSFFFFPSHPPLLPYFLYFPTPSC